MGTGMTVSVIISIFALTFSVASFAVNLRVGQLSAIRGRKPVLVFVDEPDRCWVLQNIGNGPALNVTVAQRQAGHWFNPVRVRPLGKDGANNCDWLGRVNDTGLGVTYSDSEGRRYTSTLGGEILHTYEGDRLPKWGEATIEKYWSVQRYSPAAERWGLVRSDFST